MGIRHPRPSLTSSDTFGGINERTQATCEPRSSSERLQAAFDSPGGGGQPRCVVGVHRGARDQQRLRRHDPADVPHLLRLVGQHPAGRRHLLPADSTAPPAAPAPTPTRSPSRPRPRRDRGRDPGLRPAGEEVLHHGGRLRGVLRRTGAARAPTAGPGCATSTCGSAARAATRSTAIDCEDALTHYNSDNTPSLEPVIVSPPSNETVDSTPLFNTGTGACYGGAQPHTTVGQYKNGSNGQCIDDPNNSSSSGTALKTAACNGCGRAAVHLRRRVPASSTTCARTCPAATSSCRPAAAARRSSGRSTPTAPSPTSRPAPNASAYRAATWSRAAARVPRASGRSRRPPVPATTSRYR